MKSNRLKSVSAGKTLHYKSVIGASLVKMTEVTSESVDEII